MTHTTMYYRQRIITYFCKPFATICIFLLNLSYIYPYAYKKLLIKPFTTKIYPKSPNNENYYVRRTYGMELSESREEEKSRQQISDSEENINNNKDIANYDFGVNFIPSFSERERSQPKPPKQIDLMPENESTQKIQKKTNSGPKVTTNKGSIKDSLSDYDENDKYGKLRRIEDAKEKQYEVDAFYEAYWNRKSRNLKLTPKQQRLIMDKYYPKYNSAVNESASLLSEIPDSLIDMKIDTEKSSFDKFGKYTTLLICFLVLARFVLST